MRQDALTHESPLAAEVSGLSKRFPGVVALDQVDLAFPKGKVTAVVGENGAGKSTLMTIIAGLQRPDGGTVVIGGDAVEVFSPHALLRNHAVALVPQEIALCRDRSVAENVLLGQERRLIPSRVQMERETAEVLASIDADIDPARRAGSLSFAEQQLVLIARALARRCEILILDEPTTSLTQEEVDHLFALLRRLRNAGTSIIYVSHRLPEIFALADLVHVLRDGRHVASYRTPDVTPDALVRAMVGRQLEARVARATPVDAEPTLETTSVSGRGFTDATFAIRRGEIVGLAGLPDSGRGELLAALFGAVRSTGSIRLAGTELRRRTPRDAIDAGIGYVPAERRSQAIFPDMSIATNMALLDLDQIARLGFVSRSAILRLADARMEENGIRGRARGRITKLSGGNQQKVILSRWLARSPRLLLLDDPTRGVDVGAKADIHTRLRESADRGMSILMASSELPELLRNCDRLIVMARGRIVGEVDPENAGEDDVMALATGLAETGGLDVS